MISELDNKLIIYSDGSQSQKGSNGAGIFSSTSSFKVQNSQAWNLGTQCEVFDAELYAIYQAILLARKQAQHQIALQEVWIFSDSQAALQKLQKPLDQESRVGKIAQAMLDLLSAYPHLEIHLHWVPGHQGVYGNEKADEAAKYGAEWQEPISQAPLSYTYMKRDLKARSLKEWEQDWQLAKSKASQHYLQFASRPKWKLSQLQLPKQLWSTITQLKLGHGYFRSYLVRLPDYNTEDCPNCQYQQR